MAAAHRRRAAMLQRHFLRPGAVADADPELAHLTLYPYANPELLHRYGRLNGPIVEESLPEWLGDVSVPVLLVTSDADTYAHPDGSRRAADRIPTGRLHVEPSSSHLASLTGAPRLVELASRFSLEHGERDRPRPPAAARS